MGFRDHDVALLDWLASSPVFYDPLRFRSQLLLQMRAMVPMTYEPDQRDSKGRFLSGNKPGPGRPKGSRSAISEDFLQSLHREWQRSGDEALARVAKETPHIFVKVVANLLPKEIDIDQALTVNLKLLAERDFGEAFAFALKTIGSEIEVEHQELIELNGNATDD